MSSAIFKAYEENLLEFEAVSLNTSEAVWVSDRFPNYSNDKGFYDSFRKSFSYGSTLSDCFDSVGFDQSRRESLSIERYGGYGITKNGGGARCGNLGNYQIKGMGTNILIGKEVSHWYSHGALNIADAMLESINSIALGKIFPFGCVSALGIILTGEKAAYFTDSLTDYQPKPCWGALLIRERCIRPAHFMRSMFFEPRDEFSDRIPDDVSRIRKSMKVLKNGFKSTEDFVAYMAKFALRSANQFAFAKAARVSHGGLTASNISIDGRWTDLTTVTFMDSGKNYINDADQHPAFTEYSVIEQIISELIYNYSKYNNIDLNPAPLISMYENAYKRNFHKHCSYIFGIEAHDWPSIGKNVNTDELVKSVSKILDFDATICSEEVKDFNQADPILILVRALFASLNGVSKVRDQDAIVLTKFGIDITEVSSEFKETIFGIWKPEERDVNVKNSLVTALKRIYFSRLFYRAALREELEATVFDSTPDDFKDIMDKYEEVSDWVFSSPDEEINTLYKSKALEVSYNLGSNDFTVSGVNDSSSFESFSDAQVFIDNVVLDSVDRNYFVDIERSI